MKMHSHSNRLAEFGIRPRLPFASTPNRQLNPIIITLVGYLEKLDTPHALDLAVEAAYKKTPEFMDNFNITGANSFLDFANDLLRWIPHEHSGGRDIYDILCMFYFVFNQSPLKDLQTPIHPGAVGQPLTWLSSWLVVYSQLVGFWMDSPESLTKESLESFWESPLYKLEEAQEPPRGWKTFNELFSRKLKVGARPIESPDDDTVIVYPADCKYDTSAKDHSAAVFPTGIISIKGLPWSIGSLLEDSEYGSEFNGGVWMHAFLNTYNYHRQHAPVAGKVLEARTVQGTCYFEVDEGEPQSAVMRSEPYSPNSPGYR